ncbi:MAG TPA: hypothetical protein VF939_12345 [Puia sp.]
MNNIKIIITFLFITTITGACKKSNSPSGIATINIINAAIHFDTIATNFTSIPVPWYQNQAFIYFGASAEYGLASGQNSILFVSSHDTSKVIFNGLLNLKAGAIYSLYLTGQAPAIDTLFMQDMIPLYKDSVAGIRFINLSSGSGPISINLQGNISSQTEFSDLIYKKISDFKSYPANSGVGGAYNFEVRDQVTGNLLTTFTWNFSLYRNNTLVIFGTGGPSSTSPINVFAVNNY